MEAATYSSVFNVLGTDDINNADMKCVYNVGGYGYIESSKIVKTYVTGKSRGNGPYKF